MLYSELFLLGIVRALGNILLRWGNLLSSEPAVNAISFFAPLFALLWLMVVGITLPRFDLFMVGAALILAVNILIQAQSRQGTRYRAIRKICTLRYPARVYGLYSLHLVLWHVRLCARRTTTG